MRILLAFFLIILLSFIAGLYFPWWSCAIVAFVIAVIIPQRPWKGFLTGFVALFVLWCTLALIIDSRNESLLSVRIGELLGVGPHPIVLAMISGLIAALVAGMASLTGSFVRRLEK